MLESIRQPGEVSLAARRDQGNRPHIVRIIVDEILDVDQLARDVIVVLENSGGLIAFRALTNNERADREPRRVLEYERFTRRQVQGVIPEIQSLNFSRFVAP
jgi:hypothetical protein